MKLFRILLMLMVVSLVAIAAAQEGGDGGGDSGDNGGNTSQTGRHFKYTPADYINADFSKAGNVTLTSKTTVNVNTYLYIAGSLSANWEVKGWGTGIDSQTNTIRFYHNGTLTIQFSQFANPAKISGTQTGSQTVTLSGEMKFYNNNSMKLLYDTKLIPIASFNHMSGSNALKFDSNSTAGILRADFTKQISVAPNVGPGKYQNIGIISVTRN